MLTPFLRRNKRLCFWSKGNRATTLRKKLNHFHSRQIIENSSGKLVEKSANQVSNISLKIHSNFPILPPSRLLLVEKFFRALLYGVDGHWATPRIWVALIELLFITWAGVETEPASAQFWVHSAQFSTGSAAANALDLLSVRENGASLSSVSSTIE